MPRPSWAGRTLPRPSPWATLYQATRFSWYVRTTGWAAHDPQAVWQWADTFPDSADRASAKTGIRVSAPVGIAVSIGGFSNTGF